MAFDPTALAAVARLIAIIPANFTGFNHQTVFPQTGNDMGVVANAIAAEALLAINAAANLAGTSTTSTAIGTGSKSFVTQAGKSFNVGRYVQIVSAANPTTRQMSGQITAYSGTSLTVEVTTALGSGSAADWTIYLSGPAGKGEPGDDGNTILGGGGAPDSGDGIDGDFYIDTTANAIYGPKAAGAWGAGKSLVGPAGNTVRSGTGAPSSGLGVDGDWYIDTGANTIYGPKTAGAWGSSRSIKGADGKTVHSGAGDPGGGLGVDGDFYMDTVALKIFGPKTSGSWGAGAGLRGSAATLEVGSVATVAAGEPATVINVGTPQAATFNFEIPEGDPGSAATIEVGTVSGLPAGSTPTVTNVGTSGEAVLNFALPQGAAGPAGPVIAASWNFSTTTTDADPGNGNVRLNHATPASATFLYFDNLDAGGATVTAWLDALDDSTTSGNKGTIRLAMVDTPTTFADYRVTGAVVDGTGYRKVPVAYVTGSGTPTNGAKLAFSFARTGDAGPPGAGSGDVTTTGAVAAGDIAVFADGTGKVLESGGTFSSYSASLLGGANEGAWKAALNLEIGVDVQAHSATLGSFASLATAANKGFYATGAGVVAEYNLTSFGRTLGGLADYAALKAALTLVKGDVGLGNVDNTSDSTKNAATATLTNKTISGLANTITNLVLSMFASGVIDTDGTLSANSDLKLATQKAVKTYLDQAFAANDALVMKGGINASTNPNYPAADAGHVYRITTAGRIGGASGPVVEINDTITCFVDGSTAGNHATVGANWFITQVNIDGAVTGPASSTSGRIATFNGSSGKVIQDGGKALPTGDVVGTSDVQTLSNKTLTSPVISSPTGLVKSDVGLDNVSNTAPADLPISADTQAALDAKEKLGELAGINTQTGTTYQLALADLGKVVEMNNGSAMTLTVPPNSTVTFPVGGRIDLTRLGAGTLTIAAGSGVTIRSAGGKLKIADQYGMASLYKRGTNEWVLAGGLSS
ncbi:hypothetical protein CHELA1G11_12858 [Hyphomicrobiales bacterium]|nr:hypothetical protein CHELA1G2_11451 [Hyphomicrobiales bacterium]CAH1667612.1 hypothetical protein CHELA1G11_12858 [Hyphomicrobiales bacterium]